MSVHTDSAPFSFEYCCHVEDVLFFPRKHIFFSVVQFLLWHFSFSFRNDAHIYACTHVDAFVSASARARVCLCFWFGNSGTRHFISCEEEWRYTRRNERWGRDQAKERVDGQAGWRQKKMCIRSHCASNVITGSDSSVWHAALPICQSEIGRVTNGYHCHFPQPPTPPTTTTLMSLSFFRVLGEKSDLNLGGSPCVGGPRCLWISADIRTNLTC